MAEEKTSFILYADLLHTVNKMPDDKAGILLKTILEYVNDLNPSVEDLLVDLVFEPIKQQLKRDLKNYEHIKEERSRNGRIGNLKRWNEDLYKMVMNNKMDLEIAEEIANSRKISLPDKKTTGAKNKIANIADNVNDTVNGNDINISFSEFWDLYDKKVGDKAKIEAKWKSISDKDREKTMRHIPLYKVSTPNKKYRKDPSTYLNNKSWNDEVIDDQKTNLFNDKFKPQEAKAEDF